MTSYIIGEARYEGEKLVEVGIQCMDQPEGPHYYLWEYEVAPVSDVVQWLKQGDEVITV